MYAVNGIFSIRLVMADFYMEKPALRLDPCYSEWRGKEIKRVPIIRIFGANANGQKSCMHVHGVFPYFYIPYDKKDFETLQRGIYQIASGLDKAINISLGQSSSSAQHVFKIQLVQGTPFYGYHRANHLFLKIYMFNPRFVRRAANLLQNAAILNKNFNPHESHVPYILQFMIDYNLYGMSFLHVPSEIVKFRRNSEQEVVPMHANIPAAQLLDTLAFRKVSCSSLEVDISASFILNRFQLVAQKANGQANPGIEAIWHDERIRRQKLAQSYAGAEDNFNAVPVLEVPVSQPRTNIEVAESEIFYRSALLAKLLAMENSTSCSGSMSDQTLNESLSTTISTNTLNSTTVTATDKKQKRTFNLKKVLANSVYPEECTQEDQLVNASLIENHLPNNNVFQSSLNQANQQNEPTVKGTQENENPLASDTLIDEELVLSLTQPTVPLNASLREEDMQLLELLQQLEENNIAGDQIDLDSTLAPLTQQHKLKLTPDLLYKQTKAAAVNQTIAVSDSESEDETADNMHDFSMAMDDIDELLLKSAQRTERLPTTQQAMPQIDGSDDLLLDTPKKKLVQCGGTTEQRSPPRTPSRTPNSPKSLVRTATTPSRSPRTPKSSAVKKYAPLPLVFSNKSAHKKPEHVVNYRESPVISAGSMDSKPEVSAADEILPKTLTLSKILHRRLTITEAGTAYSTNNLKAIEPVSGNTRKLRSRTRGTVDLDKTHITCALGPRRRSARILKTYAAGLPGEDNTKRLSLTTRLSEDIESCFTPLSTTAHRSSSNRRIAVKLKDIENADPMPKGSQLYTKFTETVSKNKCNVMELHAQHLSHHLKCKCLKVRVKNSNLIKMSMKMRKKNKPTGVKTCGSDLESMPVSVKGTDSANDDEVIVSDTESSLSSSKLRRVPHRRSLRLSMHRSLLGKQPKTPKVREVSQTTQCTAAQTENSPLALLQHQTTPMNSPNINLIDDYESELMQSFYDKSFLLNSPSGLSEDAPSPSLLRTPSVVGSCTPPMRLSLPSMSGFIASAHDSDKIIITPMDLPPTYADALAGSSAFELYEYEWPQPFYSKSADITKMKEVGFTVLHVPGNKLNDCTEFKSLLSDVVTLKQWRCKQLEGIGGPMILNRHRKAEQIAEYFATAVRVRVEPLECAPSRQTAKIWAKARELLNNREQETEKGAMDDSPIKIRPQKVTMMLLDGVGKEDDDGDGDMDCSLRSLSLTPMTPGTPMQRSVLRSRPTKSSQTPLTSKVISAEATDSQQHKRSAPHRARLSLNAKLRASQTAKTDSASEIGCVPSAQAELVVSGNSLKSSQTSDDSLATSEAALAELERASFLRQLQQSVAGQCHDLSFGLTNATLNNTFGFKVNLENLQQAKADIEYNYLTIMTLELFVPTRGELYPDPMHDQLRCIFYAIEHSMPAAKSEDNSDQKSVLPTKACGYIIVNDPLDIVNEGRIHGIDADIVVQVVNSEVEALEALFQLIARWDPDIYAGYEIEMSSWGYIIERAKHLCFNIVPMLSRVPTQKVREFVDEDREHFTDLDVEMKICGRILLDVWRLMRSEIALTSYTFENVMYHIMHKRCPLHSYRSLSEWFASPSSRWIVLEYYLERVRGTLALLDQLDLIGRTSEMAKLIGIQFYEVLSRGSQFRVESMMLRIAKPKNLVPLSPSVQQRAHMRAPEYLALIMEPQSRFYADPLIVLDFQSLYPSMIIAYNYCFSTCLGRVEHLGNASPFEFGASQLRVSPDMLKKLMERDLITISPCGVVFVKAAVREGILPRMLTEILDTRQMVKQSMKLHKHNTALQRILHSRQLGLKLMANVTYGYTAANFSGRMPSVEVGDTVVSKGRETLERAIQMVEANKRWNVRVVYGDTDSMFVLVPGRNRAQAFKIGEEIAETVTQINPHPVKLKLEKVYQPCILQTKKRYVGYMYETPDQVEPVYEAKGIETVRRDGCPAVAKMLEKVLRILFTSADVSQVKEYVCRQFTKLLSGRANLQDLIFAKEFRGLNGYKPTACVPALEMTRKWLQNDPRRIPRRGERVPFIIINGPPGVPLIRLVRSPYEVFSNTGYKINAIYYITKAIIPPLNRCLLLIGADVHEWFTNLPRKLLFTPALSSGNKLISSDIDNQSKKSTISQYFSNTNCVIDCGRQTKVGICLACATDRMKCFVTLHSKMAIQERGYQLTQQICQSCCGRVGDLSCASLDCPVLYVLDVKRRDLKQVQHFCQLLEDI